MSKAGLVVVAAVVAGGLGFLVGQVTAPVASSGSVADADVLAAIARQEKSIDGLRTDVQALERRVERAPRASGGSASGGSGSGMGAARATAAGSGPGAAPGARAAGGDVDGESSGTDVEAGEFLSDEGEQLATRLEKRIEEKLERAAALQRNRGPDGKWKPAFDDLVRELELAGAQTEQVKQIFDDGRNRAFELLNTPGPDGPSVMERFVADLEQTGDEGASTRALFKRITTERVPGSDSTYLERVIQISEGMDRALGERLTAQQHEHLKGLQVDLLEVKTGSDPFGDFVRERLAK